MKKIIITIGDPVGCGPYITLKAIDILKKEKVDFFVVGDRKILEEISIYKRLKKRINLIDVGTAGIERIKKGIASPLGGKASLTYLNEALNLIETEKIHRLVTAPLSKEAVQFIESKFTGHTEYLAQHFKAKKFAMMMVSGVFKTVLLTRHIPLRDVPTSFNKKDIINAIYLIYSSLEEIFKIKEPKIAIASLNPHAGINTFLDKEEELITEALRECKQKIFGPFPSDTLFVQENIEKYDCIICLYHDQAMIPFKLLSMKDGVNVTLGLPIIRTSPAHGVAYDVIKNNKIPFSSSMVEAIKLAIQLRAM